MISERKNIMKMKKMCAAFLACMMALSMMACGGNSAPAPAATEAATEAPAETEAPETEAAETEAAETEAADTQAEGILLMATTTSTDNTGLLDYLAPMFKEATGYELQWTAVGTGEALQMGMDGQVDIVLVHSKAKEEDFVANNYGVERFQVMYNDFVIVGPKEDGAVEYSNDVAACFTQIKDESLTFVSRGDDSGTHNKELKVWENVGIADYDANENYVSAGAGMGDTLVMAEEMNGYCLTDRGTWLAKQENLPGLTIVCEGAKDLLNQYGVIAVNPDMFPDVNNEAANAFIEWICSEEIQTVIGEFGVDTYGQPLFWPNANE